MTHVPDPKIAPVGKRFTDRLSFVWLVPLGALLVSLGVVWKTYVDQGPLIEIMFKNASGIKPDETELRYRDVPVGVVEAVTFTENLSDVLVKVRIHKDVAPYVDGQAQFWVVRPQVSARGVSGLDTVLSGVFIEGSWDETITKEASLFEGFAQEPLVRAGQEGLRISLRSSDVKGLSEDTPILFRGIEVGKIANLRLAPDGVSVLADAFIRSPEDRLVTTATRFWDTSGFSFSFGAQGAQLEFSSLATLLGGGVAFDTIVSGGSAVDQEHQFQLFASEDVARNSVFTDGDEGQKVNLAMIFEGSVSGLSAGAAVEFQGINIGTVTAITGLVDAERFQDSQVRLLATIELRPTKMGLSAATTRDETLAFLDDQVQRGLRAQLQNASILTGGLKVALLIPDSIGPELPAKIDRNAEPYPVLPSIPATLSDFSDTAEGVFNRINELPIEELLGSAINVMDSVNRLLNEDGVVKTPAEVLGLIGDIRGVVGSEKVQELPGQASDVMTSLSASVTTLESLLKSVENAGAAEKLVSALESAQAAADAVAVAVTDVPALMKSIEGVAQSAQALMTTANELPLEALITQVNDVLASAESLLSDPQTKALPTELTATIAEARGVIVDLRASGIISQVSTTLSTAEQTVKDLRDAVLPVIAAAQTAANDVAASVSGVPGLIAELEKVATSAQVLMSTANTLPLNDVVAKAGALIASANALLDDVDTKALPGQLRGAITEATGAIQDIRQSGVIEEAGVTLNSTRNAVNRITNALMPVLETAQNAVKSIDAAATDLPGVVDRANAIARQIEALVQKAGEVPLDELASQASTLINSANTLLASADTQAVPGALNSALAELEGILSDMRNGGLIDNANATLSAAEDAASAVARASADLPGLVSRMNSLLAQAEQVVNGYRTDGALGSETKSALRDVREAAKSVSSLARAIERAPNSLLFGR